MNQGQFNELMGELRGIATKLDRLIDGQTQQQTVSGMDEKELTTIVKQSWIDLLNETLTPDKPKATKKAKA